MAIEKKALSDLDITMAGGGLDALLSGAHKANEPNRGHGLTSGVVHGAGAGLGHALGSAGTLFLLSRLMGPTAAASTSGTALRAISGLAGGAIGGRALPAMATAALDKVRPSHREGFERTASLKGGAMSTVQELAKIALVNVKTAEGPASYEPKDNTMLAARMREMDDISTKPRFYEGGPAINEMILPESAGMNRFLDPTKSLGPAAANAALATGGALSARVLTALALNKMLGVNPAVGALIGHLPALAATQIMPKFGSVNDMAKIALEGSDPMDSQGHQPDDRGLLHKGHDILTHKLFGVAPSLLQLGGAAASAYAPNAMKYAPEAVAAYTGLMQPDQRWISGLANAATAAGGAHLGRSLSNSTPLANALENGAIKGIPGSEALLSHPEVTKQLAMLLGGNFKISSNKSKKANLTQPMGEPVKSEFAHEAMIPEPEAGSMGEKKKDTKKEKKAVDEGSVMRSFMTDWNKASGIHAKINTYKNAARKLGRSCND